MQVVVETADQPQIYHLADLARVRFAGGVMERPYGPCWKITRRRGSSWQCSFSNASARRSLSLSSNRWTFASQIVKRS